MSNSLVIKNKSLRNFFCSSRLALSDASPVRTNTEDFAAIQLADVNVIVPRTIVFPYPNAQLCSLDKAGGFHYNSHSDLTHVKQRTSLEAGLQDL